VPNNLLNNYIGSLTQKGIAKKEKAAKAFQKRNFSPPTAPGQGRIARGIPPTSPDRKDVLPKSEARNPKQIQNTNDRMTKSVLTALE